MTAEKTFLKGATLKWGYRIGGEAIVSAGSVVGRDIPDRTVAAGNPARLIGPVPADEPVIVE